MSSFSTRKRWAVWVMIAWLATVVSLWSFELAGESALQGVDCKSCRGKEDPCQLADKILELELVGRAPNGVEDARRVLRCGQPEDRCVAGWVRARILADFLFIPSYSALMAFIFLMLAAPWEGTGRSGDRLWAAVGILLALAMALADVSENLQILRLAGPPCAVNLGRLHLLWISTATKWGAIALGCVLAGILALVRRRGVLTVLTGLAGLASGAVLAVGTGQGSQPLLKGKGPLLLFFFFSLAMIHAVAVVIRPDPKARNEERNP